MSSVEGNRDKHREIDCLIDGCHVCMPPIGVVVSAEDVAELERLRTENERLRGCRVDECERLGHDIGPMHESSAGIASDWAECRRCGKVFYD